MLKDDKAAKDLEEATGRSREELEQFAKKFEKPPATASRPGEEIEVKPEPGHLPKLDPRRKVAGPNADSKFSGRATREAGATVQDTLRGDSQAIRSEAPPEIRSRVEAYKSSLSRSGR